VALAQLLLVMPDVPVQNVSVSSTLALTVICAAVLAATVPLSIAVDHELSEYVVTRAQKVVLSAVGLVMPVKPILTFVGEPVFELLATRRRPLVVNVPVQVPPEPIPLIVPTDALVDVKPDGTPVPEGEQVSDAESQMSMLTDFMVVLAAGVNVNV
jgi:hypothetical protein